MTKSEEIYIYVAPWWEFSPVTNKLLVKKGVKYDLEHVGRGDVIGSQAAKGPK